MKTIHTEIVIGASATKVWEILADFRSYPEWNPSMPEVWATLTPHSHVDMQFRTSRKTLPLVARILVAQPGRELRWTGPNSKLQRLFFRGEHYWLLERESPERTRLLQGEVFSGLLVPLMSRFLDREVAPAFEAFNFALKARAEQAASVQ